MLFTAPTPSLLTLALGICLNRGPARSFHIMWAPESRTRPGAEMGQGQGRGHEGAESGPWPSKGRSMYKRYPTLITLCSSSCLALTCFSQRLPSVGHRPPCQRASLSFLKLVWENRETMSYLKWISLVIPQLRPASVAADTVCNYLFVIHLVQRPCH